MVELESLKQHLITTSEDFRQLHEQHQDCEHQLDEINQKSFLSQEDEVQEKQLKIQKLHLKDQMHMLLQEHLTENVA